MIQHADWSTLCSAYGIGRHGSFSDFIGRGSEVGTRVYVRRWRDTSSEEDTDNIRYRFRTSGTSIDFGDATTSLQIKSKWKTRSLEAKHIVEAESPEVAKYEPHAVVRQNLMLLLHQYAQQAGSTVVREAFATLPMNATGVQLTLHDSVEVAAKGYFQGYRETISIYATNRYGQDKRDRYDIVEVIIPADAGGAIASSRDLVRPTPDSALAGVLAILTVQHGERETCLLLVMFFRTEKKRSESRLFVEHVTSRFRHVFYGSPYAQWVALYPLVTLRAPALAVADPRRANCFVLFSAQYISRGLWEELPSEMVAVEWDPMLRRRASLAPAASWVGTEDWLYQVADDESEDR